MRRTIYLFILCHFVVSIVSAQNKDELISIQGDGISLKEALSKIEEQSNYSIAYEHSKLDLAKPICLSIDKMNVTQAIKKILEKTGHTFKIKGYHIILYPMDHSNNIQAYADSNQSSEDEYNQETEGTYYYTGVVLDSVSREPLSYTTITLLDDNGNFIAAGISNEKGRFDLKTQRQAQLIKISFIGYQTRTISLTVQGFDLTEILLAPDEQMLNETTITARGVDHKVDRNSYLVTDKMRERASNAQELLDQIHGVRFDKLSNSIKVGNETAVLLLVDGIQQSGVYIKNLPTNRISKIEVITEPSGRHLSDGYAAIINFILKEDYQGYDINIRNMSMTSLAGYNGDDWLINDQPGIGITYTKDKINLFANYVYANIHMNTPIWKKQEYKDLLEIESKRTGKDNQNNIYGYMSNYLNAGINYQLNPNHTISFQGDYTFQNIRDNYLFDQQVRDIKNNISTKSVTTTRNKTRDKDYVGTLFYKGEIGDNLKIYSDFTYNHYKNDVENRFNQDNNFLQNNLYKESKSYTKFNLEGDYILSSKLSLNLGYVNVWRKYDSENINGEKMLNYSERRNQLFSYLQYNTNDKLSMKAGASMEYINIRSDKKNSFWNLQPYFQLNYKASEVANINISYLTNSYYPTLYQLSPMTTAVDSIMMQSGNPNLRSAVRHTISVKATFWDRLTIKPMFKFTPKRISEIYTYEKGDYFSTFANINVKQYAVQVIYDQPLGGYFNWNSTFTYYYDKSSYKGISNSYHGLIFDSEVGYFNPKWNLGAQVGYYRSIDKGALLQGYQMVNMDSWMLSVQKQFWKKRASLMISYFLPLEWGVRGELKKEIDTPFYKESYTQSLKPYRNMLMVRFNLRFNSGKTRSSSKQSATEREERAKRAAGF